MTSRDHRDIHNLYYFHRFTKSSIARLYGLSRVRIGEVLNEKNESNTSVISDTNCLLCGLEDCQTFFIDGNDINHNPQNIIMLCEGDRRRIMHMQLRRRGGLVKPQF